MPNYRPVAGLKLRVRVPRTAYRVRMKRMVAMTSIVARKHRKTLLGVAQREIDAETPVDTGRLLASWRQRTVPDRKGVKIKTSSPLDYWRVAWYGRDSGRPARRALRKARRAVRREVAEAAVKEFPFLRRRR